MGIILGKGWALNLDSAGLPTYTLRIPLKTSSIFGSGLRFSRVRVTLTASAGSGPAVSSIYFGKLGTAPSAVSLTQMFFGGSGSTTIGTGASATTDWLNFSNTPGDDHIVSLYTTSGGVKYANLTGDGGNIDLWYKAGDEASTASVSGYTQDTYDSPFLLSNFEIDAVGGMIRQNPMHGGMG